MTTTMNKKIVTFGEIMLRLASPGAERFLQSPRFEATFGGGEANVAIALASFGLPAVYVTALPEKNPIADAAIAQLRGLGVDTSHIVRGKGRMGIYFLEAGANQRPSRVVYDRENSAIALAKPGDIDWKKCVRRRRLVSRDRDHAGNQRVGCGAGAGGDASGARTWPDGVVRSELSQESLEVGKERGWRHDGTREACGRYHRQ